MAGGELLVGAGAVKRRTRVGSERLWPPVDQRRPTMGERVQGRWRFAPRLTPGCAGQEALGWALLGRRASGSGRATRDLALERASSSWRRSAARALRFGEAGGRGFRRGGGDGEHPDLGEEGRFSSKSALAAADGAPWQLMVLLREERRYVREGKRERRRERKGGREREGREEEGRRDSSCC